MYSSRFDLHAVRITIYYCLALDMSCVFVCVVVADAGIDVIYRY